MVHLYSISITYDDVLNELNRLKTNKSCNPDNCDPCVLKEIKDGPCTCCLPNLYKMVYSLTAGKIQQSWPLTKKVIESLLYNNYRPISLTSIFCRMLVSIFKNKIMSYFTLNNLFCLEQHGFRIMRSCETQLLTIVEHWTR